MPKRKRNVSIQIDVEALMAFPETPLKHNALIGHQEAKAFLVENNGTTAVDLQLKLESKLGRKISLSSVYSLLKRYKISVPLRGAPSDDPQSNQIAEESASLKGLIRFCARKGDVDSMVELSRRLQLLKSDPDQYFSRKIKQARNRLPQTFNWGPNRNVYIVLGASCSGKSWVCEALEAEGLVCYVRFDGFGGNFFSRVKALEEATLTARKPIVFDPLLGCLSRLDGLSTKCVVILETEEVIRKRALSRGAVLGPNLGNRLKRLEAKARKAEFSGTSAEILDWLRSKLQTSSS